jgi:hypothetical protein
VLLFQWFSVVRELLWQEICGATKMKSNTNLKLAATVLAVLIVAIAFGATGAMAMFTRFFCTASISIFAIASTLGLVTRMRA